MVEKTELGNGIRVLTERVPEAHSATIGIWVANGSRHERSEENGISHFIEHMLFKGTERRSALDIAREIDSVGGLLNAFTSREYSCYFAKVLGDNVPLAIDLLSDIVLHSVFDPEEIEKERRVLLQEIYMVEDSPEDQVHDLFSQNFWQNHPLGLSVLGSRETVGAIDREGLLAFKSERYCGKNILVCAAGNIEHHALVQEIEKAFSPVGEGEVPLLCTIPEYHGGLSVLKKKGLEQAHICLGIPAPPQNHERRFDAYVLNTVLGSSMSSRLFQTIREEWGLAYSVYSYLNCHSDAGAMVVYAGTSTDQAPKVVELVLKEMRQLQDRAVSSEELESARDQLKGNLLISLESTDNLMTRLAKNELYFGRQVPLQEVMAGFEGVTPESLQYLARTSLTEEGLSLQVIGDVDEGDLKGQWI